MKKYSLTVLAVLLVCTFLTACSKEIDNMTESVNEKESSVIENPTVLEDTTEIVFPCSATTTKMTITTTRIPPPTRTFPPPLQRRRSK